MRLLLLPLMAILLAACEIMPTRGDIDDVDMLVANQQYGQALEILARADPAAANYDELAAKRRHVESLTASHEQSVRQRAQEEIEANNWRAALDRYDDALARLPQSMVLRDGLAELHRRQHRELARLESERLLAQGRWLRETLPSYEQIARVDPRSRQAQQQLERMQRQAEDIANQLVIIGSRALDDGDLVSADKHLRLANELSDTPAIRESYAQLTEQQESRRSEEQRALAERQRRARAAEQSRQRQIGQHQERYQVARQNQQFLAAREQLAELQRIDPRNPDWAQEEQGLEQAIAAHIDLLLSQGINAYSRGEFEEAAASWEELLTLDPDHKLAQDNLDRAQKVLQRIEELKAR